MLISLRYNNRALGVEGCRVWCVFGRNFVDFLQI